MTHNLTNVPGLSSRQRTTAQNCPNRTSALPETIQESRRKQCCVTILE